MKETCVTYYHSKIGLLEILNDSDHLLRLSFTHNETSGSEPDKLTIKIIRQLDEYFCGLRRKFDIPFKLDCPEFYSYVWKSMSKIPYAQTRSYGEIASQAGYARAARAVGNACSQNPLILIIPCHRVIKSDGTLGGFTGGLWKKKWLLDFEKNNLQPSII